MSDLIRRKDAIEIVIRTCGDYATAFSEIGKLPAVDAVEVVREKAVDYGYLADWYIRSVTNDPPVWTEEHIEELFNDFYLLPKGERRAVEEGSELK